ncbi:unnamed protein product [Urochloa decumbens]|uniref:Tyrosine specific protein phosphatases domain-containing protein n=1 Tax=Urochloa decumbens TaxID=240449 RepID=A0ABC9AI56_9POAL
MADVAANKADADLAATPTTTVTAAPPDINALPPPAVAVLDPHLFMAARRGDKEHLEQLLLLLPDDGGDRKPSPAVEPTASAAVTTAKTMAQVIVQVDGPPPPPAPPLPPHLLDGVTPNQGDTLLHVVATAGDGEGFLDCARTICQRKSALLFARNGKGNTPLHCAAGAGNAGMVACIVALAAAEAAGGEAVTEFLRMRNKSGETALHQAVRAGSKVAVDTLMAADPDLASVPCEADEGDTTSPLYLAISLLGREDIAGHLIDKSSGNLPSWSGPRGRNVLHAAVTRTQALPMLLELFKDVTVDVQQGRGGQHVSSVPLLTQLTMQRDDDGSTPLHLAASLDWWPRAWVVSERFSNVWPWSKPTATMLLDANICAAYQPDNKGLYPIHVAALGDNLDVTKVLLQRCPDCATLQDGEGRTFLHVAAGRWRGDLSLTHKVACYACRQPKLSTVLNVQDNNGDTALHCAIHMENLEVLKCLIRNPQVDVGIPNNDDLTPLDLSWSKTSRNILYQSNPVALTFGILLLVGAPAGGNRSDLFREKYIGEIDEEKMSEDLAKIAQSMIVVSVLIATVTFASAFTLPGGLVSADNNSGAHEVFKNNTCAPECFKKNSSAPGTPILAGSYMFSAFIFADALAFIWSCLATFSLVFAGMSAMDLSARYYYTNISASLLDASKESLMASFALGLYLVLAPTASSIAFAVCVLSILAFVFLNMEVLQMLRVVRTAGARLGIRGLAVWCDFAPATGAFALSPFLSLIVIFGLPAIIEKVYVFLIVDLVLVILSVILRFPSFRLKVKERWKGLKERWEVYKS